MNEVRFIARIQHYEGLKGEGKNKRYSNRSSIREFTFRQAKYYLMMTFGACAEVGSGKYARHSIWPTLDKKWAVQSGNRVRLFGEFEDAIIYVHLHIKKSIVFKISRMAYYAGSIPVKYKYKVACG